MNRTKSLTTVSAFIVMLLPAITGCSKSDSENNALRPPAKASVNDDGRTITFPEGSPGLRRFSTSVVRKGTAMVSVVAPARVVASISSAVTSKDRIVLFDSPDVTSLYSQYRQARANMRLTSANLIRVREMFENQGVTARELNQSENDASNASAAMAEMEGRLRALGFNPVELESDTGNHVWLMSDVPENQLHEVQKGEDVDVYFASFPEKKFIGRADAIGDIVDPVTRTVKVRVTLSNSQGKFLSGMFARVDFGDPTANVIILPPSAVVTVNSRDYVFVETSQGEYHRREITLLNSSDSTVVVLKGLGDGERVVTQGAFLFKGLSFGF